MFKRILILIVFAVAGKLVAQNAPPNGFLYQAVVRDANGNLAANRTIYIQIAIKKTTANGTIVYADNYVVQSNADAMFSIVIGQGTNKTGTYSNLLSIPWGSDKFFFNLKLCVAPTLPGTGFTPSYRDMGTTQLWSVPYAMFANKAQSSMDSLTLTSNGNTRKLKLGNYTPIYFNVADQDSSKTNEIQTISRNGGRLLLNLNGGVISLPDSSALNEIQTISRTGGRITLNQGGGTISLPDSSASNELQTISKTASTITLSNGGGSVIDSDNQNLAITASKGTIQIAGGNNIKLGDSSAVNELQNLSVSTSGSNRSIGISNGNNIIVNVNDADSSVSNELQTINQSPNKGTVVLSKNGGSIVLPDSSATNEIQTISKTGNTVTLSNGGGNITVTDNQTLSASGAGSTKTISISGGNSVNINVNDGDTSMLNEIQSISQSPNKGTVVLSKNGGSIVLPDSSATNEIQTISKTGNTVSLSNGGGSINLTDADNQALSITNSKGTIQISGGNSIKLADSSATNEFQNLSVSSNGSNRNIGISNGNNIIVNVNDADSSVTNELQTISKTGNTVTLSNGGGSVTVTDNQTISSSGTGSTKTISISGGNSINLTVGDADSSVSNEIQSLSQSTNKGTVVLSKNGGSIVLPDSSASNELQTISKTGSTISLSNGGGSVIDSDNQNLAITAGKGTIQIAGGNNIKLADSSATNELQNLSLNTSGSNRNIGISNGNNIVVNVNDADSSVTNELQTISKSGNTVTLSNGGGSVTVTDNQTLSASGAGSTKTISISGGNSINLTVGDADSSVSNEIQNLSQSTNKGTVVLSKNGGSIVLPDSSASNELQTISKTGSTVTLSNGGGSVTVTDNQTLSASGTGSTKTISISGGNSINLTVGDADSSVSNEIQSLSQSTNKGTVVLSKNGGSIVLPDSSASNELQKLTLTNNGVMKTIAITKGDSVTFSVNDGDTTFWKKNSTGIYYKVGRLGIGAENTEASSVLQVSSTTQGALMPRMTEAQRTAISSPALGLLVFQTNNTVGFYFYNGMAWVLLASGGNTNSGPNNTLIYTGDGF
jgi:trimeric autotransporter adhesin